MQIEPIIHGDPARVGRAAKNTARLRAFMRNPAGDRFGGMAADHINYDLLPQPASGTPKKTFEIEQSMHSPRVFSQCNRFNSDSPIGSGSGSQGDLPECATRGRRRSARAGFSRRGKASTAATLNCRRYSEPSIPRSDKAMKLGSVPKPRRRNNNLFNFSVLPDFPAMTKLVQGQPGNGFKRCATVS